LIKKVLLQKIIEEILIKKVLLKKIIEEILILMSYCFIQSQFLLKFEEIFLWKKIFLSITIFSPDFYKLATLAKQNHGFLCKILTNFSHIRYVYDVKSPYFVKKNNIYLNKSIFVLLQPIYESFKVNKKLPTLVEIVLVETVLVGDPLYSVSLLCLQVFPKKDYGVYL
jgi:hypothetical protein